MRLFRHCRLEYSSRVIHFTVIYVVYLEFFLSFIDPPHHSISCNATQCLSCRLPNHLNNITNGFRLQAFHPLSQKHLQAGRSLPNGLDEEEKFSRQGYESPNAIRCGSRYVFLDYFTTPGRIKIVFYLLEHLLSRVLHRRWLNCHDDPQEGQDFFYGFEQCQNQSGQGRQE